jgi:hypothetical protein
MFIEANTEYTKQEPIRRDTFAHGFIFHGQLKLSEYTGSSVIFIIPNSSYTGLKKITPAPENLKRAMFRTSTRGIAKALE